MTAIRFFRIDRAQENLHYAMDITDTSGIYVLSEEVGDVGVDGKSPKTSQSDEEGEEKN